MSAAERFAKRINRIKGVTGFVLTRNDGRIITHNVEQPDNLAALVTLCGFNADAVGKTIGFSQLNYLLVGCQQQEPLLVFPFDRYFLGIRQQCEAEQEELIEEVLHVLQQVVSQRDKKDAS